MDAGSSAEAEQQQILLSQDFSRIGAGSIPWSLNACFKRFKEFVEDFKGPQNAQIKSRVVEGWQYEVGRLRMWSAYTGAHRAGQESLDFQLRDSSHTRQQILRLFEDLLFRLQDARDVLAGDYYDNNLDDGHAEAAEEQHEDEVKPEYQLKLLQESSAKVISRLFEMSMLIREPDQHDFLTCAANIDVGAFEHSDLKHVRNKFPKADEIIVQRLGNAMAHRRKYLKYRETHAAKLKQGLDTFARHDQDQSPDSANASSNIQSNPFGAGAWEYEIDADDMDSDSGASTNEDAESIAIPAPPENSKGGAPFACPYCYFTVSVPSKRSWTAHVIEDAQPYICTETTCATPDKVFVMGYDWRFHYQAAHTSAPMNDTYWQSENDAICPLCRDVFDSHKAFVSHVARHLQELALFVLSRSNEDSDITQGGNSTD